MTLRISVFLLLFISFFIVCLSQLLFIAYSLLFFPPACPTSISCPCSISLHSLPCNSHLIILIHPSIPSKHAIFHVCHFLMSFIFSCSSYFSFLFFVFFIFLTEKRSLSMPLDGPGKKLKKAKVHKVDYHTQQNDEIMVYLSSTSTSTLHTS